MIEYKEITSRKGQRLVFCKLDQLVMELLGVNTLGACEQHKSNYDDQYILHCPFCQEEGHKKKKLYVLPNSPGEDDFSTGYCFVCGRTYIHVSDKIDTNFRTPDFLNLQEPFKMIEIPKESPWSMVKYFKEFDNYSARGVQYLENRNPYLHDLWEPLGFKFFDDNVVMPFMDPTGKPIYYQIRFIDATQKDDIRYFFPPISAKPPYIIDPGCEGDNFIIVEGVYDAIAALIQSAGKYKIMAVLGSHISDYQMNYLREYYMPRKILIWMDETKISQGIAESLGGILNYCNIGIIPSTGPDPEEILNARIKEKQKIDWIGPDYGERKRVFYRDYKFC